MMDGTPIDDSSVDAPASDEPTINALAGGSLPTDGSLAGGTDYDGTPPRGWRGRRTQITASMALILAAAIVLYLVLANKSSSPSSSGLGAIAVSGATTVQRRNLVETDTESGTLSYADPQTVYNRLTGTITWLPRVGQVIGPGQPLFKVDNAPVWLMDGTTPAYRELTSSDTDGPDILELNRNLVDLGYNPDGIVVDDEWQAATTTGIDALQEAYGETETGTLTLGQVVFLPGAQLIGTLDGAVGSTGGGTGADTSLLDPSSDTEFVSLTTATTTTTTSTPSTTATSTTPTSTSTKKKKHGSSAETSAQEIAALLALLKAETAALKKSSETPKGSTSSPKGSSTGKTGDSGNTGSGDSGDSGDGTPVAILQTSSTPLVATVDLAASSQSEAVIGSHVTVEMPNGSTVGGTITAVSPVAQSSSDDNGDSGSGDSGDNGDNGSSGSSATVPVTITLNKHVKGAGLDQAAVSVNFVQTRANHVLSVPVTALLATSGSSYAVETEAPHKLIPVTTGLFAAGYVQISGPGIYPGLQVTDSQG